MTTRSLFVMTLLLGTSCAKDVGAGSKGSPSEAPATAAAPETKVANASHQGDGAHKECIYADGEKGEHAECDRNAEPDAPSQSSGHFGAPFASAEATPLAAALAANKGGTVLV